MKQSFFALLALALIGSTTASAVEVVVEKDVDVNNHTPSAAQIDQLEQEMAEMKEKAELSAADDFHNPHHPPYHYIWHCTAYPNGQGHSHGHSAYSYNYSQAYHNALYSCQRYHGYCHVHCHQDPAH